MQVQYNYSAVEKTDGLEAHIRDQLDRAIGRFEDRLTRVEVHVADLNGPNKPGPGDMRCRFEARPAGHQPIVVDDEGSDLHAVINAAAHKLERALAKRLDPHS